MFFNHFNMFNIKNNFFFKKNQNCFLFLNMMFEDIEINYCYPFQL